MFHPSMSDFERVEMKLADAMREGGEKEGIEALHQQRELFLKNTSLINDEAMDSLDGAAGDPRFSTAFRLEAIENIRVGLEYKPDYLNDIRAFHGFESLARDPKSEIAKAAMPLLGELGAHCEREDWARSFLEITKASNFQEAKEATRRIERVRCWLDKKFPEAVPA